MIARALLAAAILVLSRAEPGAAATLPVERPTLRPDASSGPAALRPQPRPQRRPLRRPLAREAAPSFGALCGDARLKGRRVPPVEGPGRCGVAAPVSLDAIDGAALNGPVTVGCDVAQATADWMRDTVRPAARRHLGAGVSGLEVWAGYACRTRNNRPGARLSEHALGRAIDIAGVTLTDGRSVTVLDGWPGTPEERAFLLAIWRGACGRFKTVLGPEADRHHRNHLHLDVARRGGRPYCR
jgi:hypothetical protein